jgi:cellobiose phosphorylase
MGITPTRAHLVIRPNLPPAWRVPGRRYGVGLHWRDRPIGVTMEPLDSRRVRVQINDRDVETGWGDAVVHAWGQ